MHVCARAAGFGFGKGGKRGVEMVCRGDVCTFNERQGYSHDPGNPVVGASERDIGSQVDHCVIWPRGVRHLFILNPQFERFVGNVIPGLAAQLLLSFLQLNMFLVFGL